MGKIIPFKIDRRPLPQEWGEARDQIDAELVAFRRSWMIVGFIAIGLAVFTAGAVYLFSIQVGRMLAVAPITQQERVAQIADVLGDIPDSPSARLQSGAYRGAPTVRAIQLRLPDVRGITARERNQACDQNPGLCQPPR